MLHGEKPTLADVKAWTIRPRWAERSTNRPRALGGAHLPTRQHIRAAYASLRNTGVIALEEQMKIPILEQSRPTRRGGFAFANLGG